MLLMRLVWMCNRIVDVDDVDDDANVVVDVRLKVGSLLPPLSL